MHWTCINVRHSMALCQDSATAVGGARATHQCATAVRTFFPNGSLRRTRYDTHNHRTQSLRRGPDHRCSTLLEYAVEGTDNCSPRHTLFRDYRASAVERTGEPIFFKSSNNLRTGRCETRPTRARKALDEISSRRPFSALAALLVVEPLSLKISMARLCVSRPYYGTRF